MSPLVYDAFNLNPDVCRIQSFGSGLINHTLKITCPDGSYILQCINTQVFKHPESIADNIAQLAYYLKTTAPDYLFVAPLPTISGQYLAHIDGEYYRLTHFVPGSHTVDSVAHVIQAYEAAKQFGRFTQLLQNFDLTALSYTLPDFHNLNLRITQFEVAKAKADANRMATAADAISLVESYKYIADAYAELKHNKSIPLRVIHHDTKINNVLFDDQNNGLCVIDLDTVMPGYFLSDIGDMMRTYLAEANEEETDLNKIEIRMNVFAAIYAGYIQEMGASLTYYEKSLFVYAGEMMIFMQALRFLTDYLNGDIYYLTTYAGQNLRRAQNQLTLLQKYVEAENGFNTVIAEFDKSNQIH